MVNSGLLQVGRTVVMPTIETFSKLRSGLTG